MSFHAAQSTVPVYIQCTKDKLTWLKVTWLCSHNTINCSAVIAHDFLCGAMKSTPTNNSFPYDWIFMNVFLIQITFLEIFPTPKTRSATETCNAWKLRSCMVCYDGIFSAFLNSIRSHRLDYIIDRRFWIVPFLKTFLNGNETLSSMQYILRTMRYTEQCTKLDTINSLNRTVHPTKHRTVHSVHHAVDLLCLFKHNKTIKQTSKNIDHC